MAQPGVEVSIDVKAEDENNRDTDEGPGIHEEAADALGDAADTVAQTATDALDTHEATVAKATEVIGMTNRVEQGTIDPNATPGGTGCTTQGAISAEATEVVTEASTCGGNCDNDSFAHFRGGIEIFGTIVESIVAPVAGPCGFFWFHKFLVAFSIVFFFINLGLLLDTMANSTVTDIVLKHEKVINYPDLYICIPAYSYFYSFVCCGDTCGKSTGVSSDDECKSIAFLNLALQSSANGCNMGMFANHDLGKTSASSCPYTGYVGAQIGTAFNYAIGASESSKRTFRQKYAGADPSSFDSYTWTTHDWATGLENKMSTFKPASDARLTLNPNTGTFAVGDVLTGGTSGVTCTITALDGTNNYIIKDLTCPTSGCENAFTDNEVITATTGSGATGTYNNIVPPLGYRYRSTTYHARCFMFKNTGSATATYDGVQSFAQMAMAEDITDNTLARPTSLVAYIMEKGKVPYSGTVAATTGEIRATEVQMPGFGMAGVGDIAYDKIKDTSKGEKAWTYLYRVASMSYPVQQENIVGSSSQASYAVATAGNSISDETSSTNTNNANFAYSFKYTSHLDSSSVITGHTTGADGGLLYAAVSFTITNFVVREITIRDYTVAEVWAAIGGLWSGSLLILMFFFSTSDVSNAKHRFYRTFNFCCPAQRDEWLEAAGKDVAEAAAAEERAALREKLVGFGLLDGEKQVQESPQH